MRVVVLGSEGQIGKPLCTYLRSKNHEVTEIDIVNCEVEDLRSKQSYWINAIDDCDFVFFLAFDVGGARYLKEYEKTKQFLDNNIKIMLNVFEILEEAKVPFIFASTQMTNMLWSHYGILKNLGEKYTNILGGMNVKFWNIYGVERDHERSHVITDLILSSKDSDFVRCRTTGEEERQFLYVDDCCEALEILSINFDSLKEKGPYHISSFEWIRIYDVALEIAKQLGKKLVCENEKDDNQKGTRNDPDFYILNFWKPKTSLSEGISNIIQEMKSECMI